MGAEALRRGRCEMCGEPDVDLFVFDDLPEEFEGVSCAQCGSYHAQAADRRRDKEHQQKMDRAVSAVDELFWLDQE